MVKPIQASTVLLWAGFTAAHAADLPKTAAPPPLAPLPPAFTWAGFYLGVNAGYGFQNAPGSFEDATYGTVSQSSSGRGGFLGGAQAGYNYQLTPGSGVVIGVETDFQGTAFSKSNAATIGTTPYYSISPSLDYFGTVRGRLGYAFDKLLIYGTGGFAYGGGSNASTSSAYPYMLPSTGRTGYAIGAGVEYAITKNISARIEGLYVNLKQNQAATTSYDASIPAYYGPGKIDSGFGIVRAGVNYRF